jgi:hypothetical protein
MFSKSIIAAIVVGALLVCADPTPSIPGPGDVYNEGSNCQIAWSADTSGTWTQMSIQLMTGNNWNMVHLADITTIDATKETTYTYPCPQVTPNSAIYFYQFKNPGSNETYWTTRFAIADTSGATTPPSESTQPNGDQIPWGTGSIVGSGGNDATTPSPSAYNPTSTTLTSPPRLAPSLSSSSISSSSSSTSATSNATSSNISGAVIASLPQAAGAIAALVTVAFTLVF